MRLPPCQISVLYMPCARNMLGALGDWCRGAGVSAVIVGKDLPRCRGRPGGAAEETAGVVSAVCLSGAERVLAARWDRTFGDPIWPASKKIDVPRVLDMDQSAPISILGYPPVMVVAEKVVTLIQRGSANTRWRDFADVIAIAARHTMSETAPGSNQ